MSSLVEVVGVVLLLNVGIVQVRITQDLFMGRYRSNRHMSDSGILVCVIRVAS